MPATAVSTRPCGTVSKNFVVGGESEDKPVVAARDEWSGTGINLRTARPEAAALRAAVEKVLMRAGYRERARQLRTRFQECRPFDVIAEIVEQA
jgi:UDP:flavonoid glycosyltransferase YjiC (YdhE family)